MNIQEYVISHTRTPVNDEASVDIEAMKIAVITDKAGIATDVETFKKLANEHAGDFTVCDPFDGNEHSYIELGAWIGDQMIAMRFMAVGIHLGLFKLLSPRTMLPGIPAELAKQLIGQGYLSIVDVKADVHLTVGNPDCVASVNLTDEEKQG